MKRYRDTFIKREIMGMSRGDVIEERMIPKLPHRSNEERRKQVIDHRKDGESLRMISREVQYCKKIMKR
jgi:hypothetical protein